MLAIAEMYVQGVLTRKVKEITETLCGVEISKSQVSELAKGLDQEIAAWRWRPLDKLYPYLVVDAHYEKVRAGARVVSEGVLKVVGISDDGYREVLGVWTAPLESEATWSDVFRELIDRGLAGVRYVVSDDYKGLRAALQRHFPQSLWQRCQVHWLRNILARVRKSDRARVPEFLRDVTGAQSVEGAREALRRAAVELGGRYPQVAQMLEEESEEILAVFHLPAVHRRRMASTNMLERLNQELRRRTRIVRIFPNTVSCLRLVCALAIETNEEWMPRRYLDMEVEEGAAREAV